jgi:uncharacterized circularly permuted ATP-grasp superfamily protein
MATGLLDGYAPPPGTFDELVGEGGVARPEHQRVVDLLAACSPEVIARAHTRAEQSLRSQGVTFGVYADQAGTEKIFPFCPVPRPVSAPDFERLERGLAQRLRALSAFLDDVYGPQKCLEQGVVPRELVLGSRHYLANLRGVAPSGGVRIHIAGIDLVRDGDGSFRVLEDNLRTPSGVSYVLVNRALTKRILPRLFDQARIRRVDHYPQQLADTLRSVSPVAAEDTTTVVLTPGPFNSAYFEHGFLALRMGVELAHSGDLFVDGDHVYVRTTRGPKRVHVIYRRVDDEYLDPEAFRPDSLLGVRGLARVYAAGNVALANALGNGVADDKALYAFVPELVKYYLGEEIVLPQVPTYVCLRAADRRYVTENLESLVVKAVDEAGGYGMLLGPQSTAAQRDDFRRRIEAEPRKYVAQPLVELSTCPTWDPATSRLGPRRVDLRPYVVTGRDGPWVLPGGLTRVALVRGSYVVNSSQGGGSKDTWVERA